MLDTNVISEAWKREPNAGVVAFLSSVRLSQLFMSVFSYTELRYGLAVLPASQRRRGLEGALQKTLAAYRGRILNTDLAAADVYAALAASNKRAGTAKPIFDLWIAATAAAHNLQLVTRNVKDFEDLGVAVFNPFLDHT